MGYCYSFFKYVESDEMEQAKEKTLKWLTEKGINWNSVEVISIAQQQDKTKYNPKNIL
jgi:hypothetical protein